jgi:hypothetical protein
MTCLFVLLLLLFSALFFGLEPAAQSALSYKDIRVLGVSLLTSDFRAFLGVCIAFCELVLIFSSVRIRSTLGNIFKVLKDFIQLLPLAAFCLAAYKAFWPIINKEIIPAPIADWLGIQQDPTYITQTVDSRSFSQGVLLTLIALLFFGVTHRILNPPKPGMVEVAIVEGKVKQKEKKPWWKFW